MAMNPESAEWSWNIEDKVLPHLAKEAIDILIRNRYSLHGLLRRFAPYREGEKREERRRCVNEFLMLFAENAGVSPDLVCPGAHRHREKERAKQAALMAAAGHRVKTPHPFIPPLARPESVVAPSRPPSVQQAPFSPPKLSALGLQNLTPAHRTPEPLNLPTPAASPVAPPATQAPFSPRSTPSVHTPAPVALPTPPLTSPPVLPSASVPVTPAHPPSIAILPDPISPYVLPASRPAPQTPACQTPAPQSPASQSPPAPSPSSSKGKSVARSVASTKHASPPPSATAPTHAEGHGFGTPKSRAKGSHAGGSIASSSPPFSDISLSSPATKPTPKTVAAQKPTLETVAHVQSIVVQVENMPSPTSSVGTSRRREVRSPTSPQPFAALPGDDFQLSPKSVKSTKSIKSTKSVTSVTSAKSAKSAKAPTIKQAE